MNKEKDKEIFEQMPKKAIFVVGSDICDDAKYRKLSACKFDAQDFYNLFIKTKPLKCDEEKTKLLVNNKETSVVKENVLTNLEDFLKDLDNNFFIFYFSGHGDIIDGKLALILKDSLSNDSTSLLFFDDVIEMINKCKTKGKLIILDACYSGCATDKSLYFSITRHVANNIITKSNGLTVIASSLDDQTSSSESLNKRNSLFTYYALEALKGTPNALKDNFLTIFGFYEYLVKNVMIYNSYGKNGGQIPSIYSNQNGILVLGDYRFNGHNWYKDNYQKIVLNKNNTSFDKYFNDLVIHLDADMWEKARFLTFEIVHNAFKHGEASSCEIIIEENKIKISDNGQKFNQLDPNSYEPGGLQCALEEIKNKYKKDISYNYNFNGTNDYEIVFSSEHVFDISKRMHLKCNSINSSIPEDFFVAGVTCKYYFADIQESIYYSARKSLIDDLLSKIPKTSKLLLRKSIKNLEGYKTHPQIEFIDDDILM